jgi:NTP pyrophosphatase (non-canonical NTP hydrolase)
MRSRTLSLAELRRQNVARCEESFYPLGDWSESDWATALAGEVGEAANLVKKRRRGEHIPASDVGKELADVVIYADLLAARMGIDLSAAIVQKFNEVSDRVASSRRL